MTNKFKLVTLVLLYVTSSLFSDYSGTINFIDSTGEHEYLYNAPKKVWIEVKDQDLNSSSTSKESIKIQIKSSIEVIAEEVSLLETDNNSGVFRGFISPETANTSKSDGIVQARKRDSLFVTYLDALNDFGTNSIVLDTAIYGYSELDSSHVGVGTIRLTKSNSPYLLTESITLNDSLIIEPGVLLLIGNPTEKTDSLKLYANGGVCAVGTENDSITIQGYHSPYSWYGCSMSGAQLHFVSFFAPRYPVSIGGVHSIKNCSITGDNVHDKAQDNFTLSLSGGPSTLEDSYIYGYNGIRMYNSSDYNIRNNVIKAYRALEVSGKITSGIIEGNDITSINSGWGGTAIIIEATPADTAANDSIVIKSNKLTAKQGVITNARISRNTHIIQNNFFDYNYGICGKIGYDIRAASNFIGRVEYNNFNGSGIAIRYSDTLKLDAKRNYWGEQATAQMEAGPNPQNIGTIEDSYDTLGYKNSVNYAQWLTEPYSEKALEISKEPSDICVPTGSHVNFAIKTSGGIVSQLKYQWYFGTEEIEGAISSIYSFTANPTDTGNAYYCIVTDGVTTDTSDNVYLTLLSKITIESDTTIDIDTTFNSSEDTVITEVITITKVTTIPKNHTIAIQKVVESGRTDGLAIFAPNPAPVTADAMTFIIPEGKNGEWTVTIYDVLGNAIDKQVFEAKAGEVYQWDLRNNKGQRVAAGSYLAGIVIKSHNGKIEMFVQGLGVSE